VLQWSLALDLALQWPHLPLSTRMGLLGAEAKKPLPLSILEHITLPKLIALGVVTQERFSGFIIPSEALVSLMQLAREVGEGYDGSRSTSALRQWAAAHPWLPIIQPNLTNVPELLEMDPMDWEEEADGRWEPTTDFAPEQIQDLQFLFRNLADGPWSFSDASQHLKHPRALRGAVDLGCRLLVLLPSWNDEFGLCFESAQPIPKTHGIPITDDPFMLVSCPVVQQHAQGNLLFNLRELLLFVGDAPPKMRPAEYRLFTGVQQKLLRKLQLPPEWLGSQLPDTANASMFVEELTKVAEELLLLEFHWGSPKGGDDIDDESHYLVLTKQGLDFLQGDYARQAEVVQQVFRVPKRSEKSHFLKRFQWTAIGSPPDQFLCLWMQKYRELLTELSVGKFFAFKDLCKAWSAQNPVRQWAIAEARRVRKHEYNDLQLKKLEEHFLRTFLSLGHGVGAIQWGVDEFGRLAMATTANAPWWFSHQGQLTYPLLEKSQMILKPDYEIAFLAPSPDGEALLAPFCEHLRLESIGLLFKINKASVQRAARLGIPLEFMEKALKSCFAKIPQNVHTEICGWHGALVSVSMELARILVCPNEEVAQTLLHLMPGSVRQLHGPILTVVDDDARSRIVKRLKKEGIHMK